MNPEPLSPSVRKPISSTIINFIEHDPRRVFLIDALGALLTALSLSFVLVPLETYFGMPDSSLYLLSAIAFCLFIYSLSCYKFVKSHFKPFLATLVVINSLYCFISIGFVLKAYTLLTSLGKAYFLLEIIIIATLIRVEWKTYRHLSLKKSTKP